MTNQTFNLDLIPQGVPPIIHVSQYDKGQTWEIHLHENGIVFPVPANTSAAIQGTKPDNTGFQFPAVITAGDNVVMFTLEQQMTVFSGDIDCELVLVNGDDQVATINFVLSVEPTTLDDNTVISETQLPLIEQAAELGAVINNYATQIHADAETASTAATTATAAATSASADATTATAAADDATASKTAAASSASNAATSETNAAASASAAASSETNAAASAAAAQAAIATDMTGATASVAGTHGLVPAPSAGDNTKFLGGDGTWKDVPAELSGLGDVDLNNLTDGQLLRYDATAQKWKNAGVDSTPTANSTNLVSSGGVKATVDDISSQISKCIKIKTAYGTIPSASSGQVYPQYPEGTSFQTPVLALRIWDANNNVLVNPSWAEVRLYQNNAAIFFSNIPQSSQGGIYYLDFAQFLQTEENES